MQSIVLALSDLTEGGVTVLGIPIPSSSPVFLSIVGVHVTAGIGCVVAGVVAMFARKAPGRHPRAGSVYFWSLVVVFLTMAALSIIRWPHDNALFALGIVSLAAAVVGRTARRRGERRLLRAHVVGMSVSYIVLLTAFYVDNGPHLPLWRELPLWAFWILPSVAGAPLLIRVLRHHPLLTRN